MSHTRQTASGRFELPLAASEAIGLFTPEGERAWVPGWDPVYPDEHVSEAPGTVFTTAAHGKQTVWVIIELDQPAARAAYARTTPGRHAGTVRVSCVDARPGHANVTVEYDMTSLAPDGAHQLDAYEPAQFAAMLDHWQAAIEEQLSDRSVG